MTKITTMKHFYYRNHFGTVFTVFIRHKNLNLKQTVKQNENGRYWRKWTAIRIKLIGLGQRSLNKLLFLNVMMCNHLNSDCGQLDFDGFMNQLNFEMSSYEIIFSFHFERVSGQRIIKKTDKSEFLEI